MIRTFSAILVTACLIGCAGSEKPTDKIDLLALYADLDTAGLAEAARAQHFQLRRGFDVLLNDLLVAKATQDSHSRQSLSAQLTWLCDIYQSQAGLSDKAHLLRKRQAWSAEEARTKMALDTTYRRLDSLRRSKTVSGIDLRTELLQLRCAYEALSDSFALAAVDYNLAECYFADGDIDSTCISLSRCRDNCLELNHLQQAGFCELFFARIHTLNDADYLASEKALLRAADHFGKVGDYRRQANARVSQAYNSSLLFQSTEAIEGFHAGYEASGHFGDMRLQAYCLYALGVTFFLENELDSAAHYSELALKMRRDLADKYDKFQEDIAYSEGGLGLIMQAMGEPDKAHDKYSLAEELFLECQEIEGLCTNKLNHASLLLHEKKYDQAREKYRFILDNSTQFENSIHAQFGIAVCDFNKGRTAAAITNLRRCIQRLEVSRNKLPMPGLTAGMLMDKLAYYQLLACIFLEQYQDQNDPVGLDSAFKYVEVSKAKSLTDMLRKTISTDDTGNQDRLIALISAHENDLLLRRGDSLEHALAISTLEDSLHSERIRSAETQDSGQVIEEYKPPDLGESGRLLKNDDAIILSYLISEYGSYVFIVCGEKNSVRKIDIDAEELTTTINSYVAAISHYPSDGLAIGEWSEYGRTLYEALIPVETIKDLGKKQLVITPAGRLHYLPFESLIDNQNRYLVESFDVSYVPSITALGILRSRKVAQHSGNTLIAFGDPLFAKSEVTPLKYSRAEVQGLVDLFRSGSIYTYLGEQATEEAFKNLAFEKARYVHVATHGICNERRPDRSALMLAEETSVPGSGLLHPDEIMSLVMPVDLVFLSACRSGSGLSYPGEGVLSLAQPFLASGAKSVVTSYWNVDDRITVRLVASFYSELVDGGSKARSLAKAKRTLINSERELYRHPYFWAPFVLIGEYD